MNTSVGGEDLVLNNKAATSVTDSLSVLTALTVLECTFLDHWHVDRLHKLSHLKSLQSLTIHIEDSVATLKLPDCLSVLSRLTALCVHVSGMRSTMNLKFNWTALTSLNSCTLAATVKVNKSLGELAELSHLTSLHITNSDKGVSALSQWVVFAHQVGLHRPDLIFIYEPDQDFSGH